MGVLSDRERAMILSLARAAMPAGNKLPGAGPDCVARMDEYLGRCPDSLRTMFRGILWSLEAAGYLHHSAGLAEMHPALVRDVIERFRSGSYPQRFALKLFMTPIKVSHYNAPEVYRAVGCKWGQLSVVKPEEPRWLKQVVTPIDLSARESIECDVVVIGSGAGGAVMAKELAERGLAVVLLEEGRYFHRQDFTGNAAEMHGKLYRDMGASGSIGNVFIPIPVGKSVGGTTTINSGTCYRAPDRVFRSWQDDYGLTDYSAESMASHYERVENILGVTEADARYLGGVARVIARGCDALGYRHKPLRRNAPECDGQGVCCFGCPTEAKRSTNVSYVPLALKAGTRLYTEMCANEIIVESRRAVGVRAKSGEKTLEVRARAVVVACGSLYTPLLLQRNRLCQSSGQLGRNLSIHPAIAAMALFDEKLDGANAIPQGYAIEEFHDEGILFEGAFLPLDVGASSIPLFGNDLVTLLESYDRIACFGLMLEDTSRGRVRDTPGAPGRPLIHYSVNDHDVARLKRGVEILARVYFAAGAKRVLPLVHGFDELRDERDLARLRAAHLSARDFDLSAYHPLGTARMGIDPRRSVVGPDLETHDLDGLYVADGSVIPSSPAVNPQLTIMALATRAAVKLANRLA